MTVFEALLTLLCFPLLVFVSYRVDQFETADVQRKKHLVEVQKALKPEGWVGFGAEDAEKTIPLRVLDEQGGTFTSRCTELGAWSDCLRGGLWLNLARCTGVTQ